MTQMVKPDQRENGTWPESEGTQGRDKGHRTKVIGHRPRILIPTCPVFFTANDSFHLCNDGEMGPHC